MAKSRVPRLRWKLADLYPGVFQKPHSKVPKQPLKLGIYWDLRAALPAEYDRLEICRFLTDYCSGYFYQWGLLQFSERIGLDGQPAGDVTEGHKQHAARRIAKGQREYLARIQRQEVAA